MQIYYFDELKSTQKYLIEKIKKGELIAPVSVVALRQSAGYGSRGNSWVSSEGNLFFSFAIALSELPSDLKLESISIYMSYILKELLASYGSHVWLKWPNDFYIQEKKFGGTITTIVKENLVCGIGLNLVKAESEFAKIDVEVNKKELLQEYFELLKEKQTWKQIFSKFKIEFERSKNFSTHYNDEKIEIKETSLNSDGSLMYKNERIYSLR